MAIFLPRIAMKFLGMVIDGILGSEAVDTSAEVLDIKGADISRLTIANYEHKGPSDKAGNGEEVVGKVLYSKKIYKADDCDNDRQLEYWNKIKLPFIYGIIRLADGAGHRGALALAALIRDYDAHDSKNGLSFSVEGHTVERDGQTLKATIIKKVAITHGPCNHATALGLLADPAAPEGYKKMPYKGDISKLFPNDSWKELRDPSVEKSEDDLKVLFKDLVKAKVFDKIQKALTAGMGMAAPGDRVNGDALAISDEKRKKLVETAKKTIASYNPKKDGDIKAFLKSHMPDVDDDFIDHFAHITEDVKVKGGLKKAQRVAEIQKRINEFESMFMDLSKSYSDWQKMTKEDNGPVVEVEIPHEEVMRNAIHRKDWW